MKLKLNVSKRQLRSVGRLGKKVGIKVAKQVGKKVIDFGLTKGGQALGGAAAGLLGPEAVPIGAELGGLIGHEAAGAINSFIPN